MSGRWWLVAAFLAACLTGIAAATFTLAILTEDHR